MNNHILCSNWIFNWMVFYRDSMFEWIIKIYRPGLQANHRRYIILDQCSHLLANQDKIRLQLWCLLLVSSLSEVPTSHPEGLLCCRASSNSDKWSGPWGPRGARRPRRNRRAGAPSGTPGWPGWRGSSYYYSQQQKSYFVKRSVAKLNHFSN